MWEKTSTKAIKLLCILLFFITPLLFTINTNELFEFPKMFFVYMAGTTLMLIYLLRIVWQEQKIQTPHAFVLVYLATNVIATLFSTHLYTSLWGYYTRFNGGLISLLVFASIYLVFKSNLSVHFMNKLLDIVVITVIPIGLYGIIQHFTLGTNIRIYSTLGQPNWLGAYVGMLLPLIVYKILYKQYSALLLGGLFIIGYATVWYTFSLSAMLGVITGVGVLLYIERSKLKENLRVLALVLLGAFLISVTQPGIYGQRVKDIFIDIRKAHAQTENIQQEQISDPGFIRVNIWKGTLRLTFNSPKNALIGTGPETFPYAFQPFRPETLNYSSEWDFILNKPHNFYLEILSETGLVGLASYLALLFWLLKNTRNDLKTSAIALATTNFFGWPTVATTLIFWFYIAYTEALTKKT